jgi:hypothetical protein
MKILMKRLFPVLCFGVLGLSGCGTAELNHKLDDKLAAIPSTDNTGEIERLIHTSRNLNTSQRTDLEKVRSDLHDELAAIDISIKKLRIVMVQDITAKNYNYSEVELIRSRMRDLGEKRINAIIKASDQANQIMGRFATDSADKSIENEKP